MNFKELIETLSRIQPMLAQFTSNVKNQISSSQMFDRCVEIKAKLELLYIQLESQLLNLHLALRFFAEAGKVRHNFPLILY